MAELFGSRFGFGYVFGTPIKEMATLEDALLKHQGFVSVPPGHRCGHRCVLYKLPIQRMRASGGLGLFATAAGEVSKVKRASQASIIRVQYQPHCEFGSRPLDFRGEMHRGR